MSEELEADNTDELIEAMKQGFAVRLADVEARAEKYRLALVECREAIENLFTGGRPSVSVYDIISEALK